MNKEITNSGDSERDASSLAMVILVHIYYQRRFDNYIHGEKRLDELVKPH